MSQRTVQKADDYSNEGWCLNLAEEQVCEPEVILLVEEFKNLFRAVYDQYALEEPADDSLQPFPGKDGATPANPAGFGSTDRLAVVTEKFEVIRESRRASKEVLEAAQTLLPGALNFDETVDLDGHMTEPMKSLFPETGESASKRASRRSSKEASGHASQHPASGIGESASQSGGKAASRPSEPPSRQSRQPSKQPSPTTRENRRSSQRLSVEVDAESKENTARGSVDSKGPPTATRRRSSLEVPGQKEGTSSDLKATGDINTENCAVLKKPQVGHRMTIDQLATLEVQIEHGDELAEQGLSPEDEWAHMQKDRELKDRAEKHGIDWKLVHEHLPWQRDRLRERQRMFKVMDLQGNGSLSLAEIDTYLCRELPQLAQYKGVIARAFHEARTYDQSSSDANWSVEKREFRILLEYLHHCFHLWVIFDRVDTGHDGHIGLDEFRAALQLLNHWGLKITEENVEATFTEIDKDHGGQILFGELCDWAIAKCIHLDPEVYETAASSSSRKNSKEGGDLSKEGGDLGGTFETEVTNEDDEDDDDDDYDDESERDLKEEKEEELDKHTLIVEERLQQERCIMGFCEFLRMLRHFGLYPEMISMHTARINWNDACTSSQHGRGGFAEFVESLCRVCFMYLSVYGNCVQQTTTSKRKFLWIITWLQTKCKARGIRVDAVREKLVKSLDQWELHSMILGGAMLRPLARGRQLGNRFGQGDHNTV